MKHQRWKTAGLQAAAAALAGVLMVMPATEAFQVTAGTETISERGEVPKLVVALAEGRFGFMLPPNWEWQGTTGERVVQMIDPSEQGSLRIRFLAAGGKTEQSGEALVTMIQETFTGAEIMETFACASRDAEGPGAEAHFLAGGGTAYRVRVARLSYPGLTVEVQLTGPAELFDRMHASWTYVMNSLGREAQ